MTIIYMCYCCVPASGPATLRYITASWACSQFISLAKRGTAAKKKKNPPKEEYSNKHDYKRNRRFFPASRGRMGTWNPCEHVQGLHCRNNCLELWPEGFCACHMRQLKNALVYTSSEGGLQAGKGVLSGLLGPGDS